MILLGFLLLNRRRQKSGFIGDVLMAALTESKRKKKRGRSLAMCVWTIVSFGLGLTSTFGSPSYNQSQPKTHGMVRSACFLAATISFSVMPRHAIFSNPCGWLLRPLFLCYVARIQMQVQTQAASFLSSCTLYIIYGAFCILPRIVTPIINKSRCVCEYTHLSV